MAQNQGPWTNFTTRTASIPGGDVDEGLTPIQRLRGYARQNYDQNTGTWADANNVSDHTKHADAQCDNRKAQAIADIITALWTAQDATTAVTTTVGGHTATLADHESRIDALEAGGSTDGIYLNVQDYLCPAAATAWVVGTAYVVGDWRKNGGNLYHCITAGTSAGSGPTTTSLDITDGSAHWRYCGAGTGRVAGTTDDKSAFDRAIAAADGAGILFRGVKVPQDSYHVANYVVCDGYDYGEIRGIGNAVIGYNSADPTRTTPTEITARSALYMTGCDHTTVRGINFVGTHIDYMDVDEIDDQRGRGISLLGCTFTSIVHCTSTYGASLVSEVPNNDHTTNYGTFVGWCKITYPTREVFMGHGSTLYRCWFEQGNEAEWDDASSHFVYQQGSGGSDCWFVENTFKNCRHECIKISGSSFALNAFHVHRNRFYNSEGFGVLFGADDTQEHNQLLCTENRFVDCVAGIRIYGSRGTVIKGNLFEFTGEYEGRCILGSATSAATQPIEDLLIEGNQITQRRTAIAWVADTDYHVRQCRSANGNIYRCMTSGNAASSGGPSGTGTGIVDGGCTWDYIRAGSTLSYGISNGIELSEVGPGLTTGFGSGVRITGNKIEAASIAISTDNCFHPIVDGNSFANHQVVWDIDGDVMPVFTANNHVASVKFTGPHIRLGTTTTRPSWPCIAQIAGHGQYGSTYPKTMVGESSTPLRWPLLGYRGVMTPTGSQPEVVIAYGPNAKATVGDVLRAAIPGVNSGNLTTIATRGASGTGAGHYTTPAELITVINAYAGGVLTASNIQAYNYAGGGGVATNHIRIRLTATTTAANYFRITRTVASPFHLVILPNSTLGVGECYSRGEDVDRAVIWSPLVPEMGVPVPTPRNAAAATAGLPFRVSVASEQDIQSCVVLKYGATLGGTEEWEFNL